MEIITKLFLFPLAGLVLTTGVQHVVGRKGRHNSNFDLTSGGFLFMSCYLSKLHRQSKTIDFRQQSNHFLLFDSMIKLRET